MEVVDLVMRWTHIMGAIIALGGVIFARAAFLPALRTLPSEARGEPFEMARKRFSVLYMMAIGMLLVSGFYNYLLNERSQHPGEGLYHGLMGAKIILGFIVFLLGSALVGTSPAFEKIRAKRARWMVINILLAMAIVGIASYLGRMPAVVASSG